MLCDRCHKREACVHIQEVRADGKRSLNLCAACALEQYSDKDRKLQDFLGVLTAISRQLGAVDAEPGVAQPELSCTKCGKGLAELKKSWVLGCDHCVTAFREQLREQIAKLQHLSLSCGESGVPGNADGDDSRSAPPSAPSATLSCLRRDLQVAVQRENYEEAARLRDRIETLLQHASDKESGS